MTPLRFAVAIILASTPFASVVAQAPYPESRRAADSLRALLPDSLKVYADSALNAATQSRRSDGNFRLMGKPEAESFVYRALEAEPNPRGRFVAIVGLGYWGPQVNDKTALKTFLDRLIAADSDSVVVVQAYQVSRELEASRGEGLLRTRLAAYHGKAAPDWLLREEERATVLGMGIEMPTFMSDPPAPFPVKHASPTRVRVLAFGDWGWTDSSTQIDPERPQVIVAKAIQRAHAARPYDFGLTLGDNFYYLGMPNPTNPRWRTQYENMYGVMGIPIYASLGNHDFNASDSPSAEILYSWYSKTWKMPARYYTFVAGPVQFWAFDTNAPTDRQIAWLKTSLEQSKAKWKVVYGHFAPYIATPSVPMDTEPSLMNTLVPTLKGRADLYVSGHIHNTQLFKPKDGVRYVISGAAGAPRNDPDFKDGRLEFGSGKPGFASLEFTATTCQITFTGTDDKTMYTTILHK